MALVSYPVAKWGCIMAVFTVMIATSLSICGFINMGTYHNISDIGVWAGLALFLPVFLGLLLMGTRHKSVAFWYFVVNILCLGLCIWSAVVAAQKTEDWNKFYDYWNQGKCYERGDQCVCPENFLANYLVSRCELYLFGRDLFVGMAALSGIGGLASLIGAILGLVGLCEVMRDEEDDQELKKPNA